MVDLHHRSRRLDSEGRTSLRSNRVIHFLYTAMVDRESEARGITASALSNETPTLGHIRPTSVSDVEGSEESLSAGFTALLEDSPLTGDALTSGTLTTIRHAFNIR